MVQRGSFRRSVSTSGLSLKQLIRMDNTRAAPVVMLDERPGSTPRIKRKPAAGNREMLIPPGLLCGLTESFLF